MNIALFNSLQSEWLKKRRSLASWLVIVGGFFVPAIIIVARIIKHSGLQAVYSAESFWEKHWINSWESMALFLLPIGVMMATSLIVQIEYKNNTWKQLHTTPLSLTTIFVSKLIVIIVMMFQFFLLFNLGLYLSAIIPYLLFADVPYPKESIPVMYFARETAYYFIDCLPIIALQYLISLKYENFLVSIGTGLLLWIGALGSLIWKYGYVIPYTYPMFNYLKAGVESKAIIPPVNIHLFALGYFFIFILVAYFLYLTKKEKG